MKSSPYVLSCIGKRTREGCDSGTKSRQFTADERYGKGPVPPRKLKESGKRGNCEKDFVSTKSSECVLIFAMVGVSGQGT